jgi:hypothetical protein
MIKAVGGIQMQWIYRIMMKICKSNEKPDHWKKEVTGPIHKDANPAIMTQEIMLLIHCCKTYCHMSMTRLVIGFIEHLQLVTISNYNTTANLHT